MANSESVVKEGVLREFFHSKGWGLLESGDEKFVVHIDEFQPPESGSYYLSPGLKVSFLAGKNPEARHVSPLQNQPSYFSGRR
jgi:hypothetical protein